LLLCAFVPVIFSAFSQETGGRGETNALETEAFFSLAAKADNYVKKGDYNQAEVCYRKFLEQYPQSRYSAFSYLRIAGIYQDYLRNYGRARELYEKVLTLPEEDKLTRLSRKIAGIWRERMGLALIEQALNRYYARKVEYPASLKVLFLKGYLKKDSLKDSQGNDYFYRLKDSSLFSKLRGQEYTLYSTSAPGGRKPLSFLIERRKAFSRQFSLQGLMGGPEGKKAVINYSPESSSAEQSREILAEGEEIGGAQVVEITNAGVILKEGETLLVLTMGR